MAKLVHSHDNYWEDVLYRFKIYLTSDFSNLSNVGQVYGAVLDEENRLLIVSQDDKNWILPGGTVEAGETLVETLKREVYEEAAVTVDDETLRPFFYQKVYSKADDLWKLCGIQARFVCRLARRDKFVKDPDDEKVKYQKFVELDRLDQFLKWGETTEFIQKEILKVVA